MITNENSVLTTLSVKFWAGFKYDKGASLRTIEENHMEKGSGNFNKRLLPKLATKDIKDIVTKVKFYFNENTLPYNALLGTRILPSVCFMDFQKYLLESQQKLNMAKNVFISEYDATLSRAMSSLGDLYNSNDYPAKTDVAKRFGIFVSYFPVPDPEAFNANITNEQVKRLNTQLADMSMEAKFDLVNRTEKVAKALMHTLKSESKRIYQSTITDNVAALSKQLDVLNYDNDPLLVTVKKVVDDNILGIRIDYLRDSVGYRKKYIEQTQVVIDLVRDINASAQHV